LWGWEGIGGDFLVRWTAKIADGFAASEQDYAVRATRIDISEATRVASWHPMRFCHAAGFGKRIEYWIIGRMLKEGIYVYLPLVDDQAVDAIVQRPDRRTFFAGTGAVLLAASPLADPRTNSGRILLPLTSARQYRGNN